MSLLSRCKKVASSVFKSSVLLEQTFISRGVCSTLAARSHSPCLPRRFTPSSTSCQRWHQVFTSHLDTNRCYSDVHSENSKSQEGIGPSVEESQEMDPGSRAPSQRPLERFSLDVLVSLLHQENAVDICVIKVPDHIKYTEFFIVASGVSTRHLRAMALYALKVYKFLKKDGDPNIRIEGKDSEDWMCIDFGTMVVHFMLPETREVYELEKLWTLRTYDEKLMSMPNDILPEDFIYDAEVPK